MGRVELLNVSVPGDQDTTIGQIVTPVGLVAFPWEQVLNGQKRWGIAYRAAQIIPTAAAGTAAQSAPPAADAA
jgi:hypothetical protein